MRIDTSVDLTEDDMVYVAWHCSPREAATIIAEISNRFEIDGSDMVAKIHKLAREDRYVSDFY